MYNTKPLFFEYLHDHLESNRHQSTSKTPEEKDELNTALNYLRTKEQSQTSSKPNPNEQINAKMEIEAIEPQTNEHETQKHNLHFFRVQLSNFLIQNNLPFDLADRQLQFVQTLIQSHAPHNILNYTVNANHVSLVTSECFRPILQEKYFNLLKTSPFSISLDTGTAKGNVNYLNLHARFFATQNDTQTTTKLLGLIELDESSTGETLYNKISSLMFSGLEGQIRRRNLIGIATDGSSNMISKKDSGVTNRFQQDLPYLLVTHDFCHCFNLILQSCIDKFPTKYVKMVKQIVSVFSQSPQKTAILKRLIRNDPERRNKIEGMKKYVKNRWTSFQDCLERILQLIEPLRQFFSEEGDSNQSTYLQKNDILMLRLLLCLMN